MHHSSERMGCALIESSMVTIDLRPQQGNNGHSSQDCKEYPNSNGHHKGLPGLKSMVPGLVLVASLDDKDDYDEKGQANQQRDDLHRPAKRQANSDSLNTVKGHWLELAII